MEDETFDRYRKIIYEKAGISLSGKKRALVRGRVSKRMRALGLSDYGEYLTRVEEDTTGKELTELLDAISTNVTHFFRESAHFEFLENVVSHWMDEGQTRFRFWSAACSSGEEPYSMAMVLANAFEGSNIDWKILATDLSKSVLRKAMSATYEKKKLDKIPPDLMSRYFRQNSPNGKTEYTVCRALQDNVVFRQLNLSSPPFPLNGPLDVVFARNVMIYFGTEVRRALLEELHRLLRPQGYLVVGHAESLPGCLDNFQPVRPSVYKKL